MRSDASLFGKDIVERELTTVFDSKWLRSKAIELEVTRAAAGALDVFATLSTDTEVDAELRRNWD